MASLLYIRSVNTLLSSMCTIPALVKKCKELGCGAIGLVDKNVLSGAMSFYNECQKENIKPILGLEVDVKLEQRKMGVILYAKDDIGFSNLMKLSSLICTRSEKEIDIETLNKYKNHNFLVLKSDDMPLSIAYLNSDDLEEALKRQNELFGEYLVGFVNHDYAFNLKRDNELRPFLKKNNISIVALSLCLYLEKEDYEEFEVLKCIRDKKLLKDDAYFEKDREIKLLDDRYEKEDIKNQDILASKCNVKMDFHTTLPKYETPNNIPSKDYLIALCKEGLKRRLKGSVTSCYISRLEYELSVITKMDFEDYFLIVYDFILYAKKKGIVVGPGRGSAAGSLVSYCLGITEIDPLKYDLLFERFLNPERISMPDIDTDFPDDRRDEVVNYVKEKYGKDHVGHIVTYGTLKAKQVLRDVARVLNYSVAEVDSICKMIPGLNTTLMDAYNGIPLFNQKINSEQRYRRLFKIALKLEGNPRHESTHAAGIVFSLKPLSEVVPITSIETDLYSTQYSAEYLEPMGLIKMDFLGLRNLGIIAEVLDQINPPININNIPLDDFKTFELIKNVNLLGVFQLESNGMQNLARKMLPNSFEELSMMIALFRPGPMENIPEFLNNRAHKDKITYLTKDLEPILRETYGIIVYQEQIMTIARRLANFSYGKADLLRRAMSKKKGKELEKLKPEFIDGCMANGYDEVLANKLYDLILRFANYGFNKSHSIAYGLLAYRMAYLKANYPLYFYKALLNGSTRNVDKTFDYIKEIKSRGIKLNGISINRSKSEYLIEDNSILLPLVICKDVGNSVALKIEEVQSKGIMKDYIEAVCRLSENGVDIKSIANLICAGAFDEFKLSRYTMVDNLPRVVQYATTSGGLSLFGGDDAPIIENKKDDMLVRAEREKEVLGFYFSFNPIESIKQKYHINVKPIVSFTNGYVSGFGQIKHIKQIKTKKGERMCFVDVLDDSANISLVLMPNVYNIYINDLTNAKYVYFEGKKDREASLIVKKMVLY